MDGDITGKPEAIVDLLRGDAGLRWAEVLEGGWSGGPTRWGMRTQQARRENQRTVRHVEFLCELYVGHCLELLPSYICAIDSAP